MPITSSIAAPDLAACGRDRSGNIPATTRKAITQIVAKAANQIRETQFGSMAAMAFAPRAVRLFGGRGKAPRMPIHLRLRSPRGLAHIGLDEAGVVTVEQMPDQPAIEIGGAEQPIHYRECQVHVALHHDRLIVMGRVMTPDGV